MTRLELLKIILGQARTNGFEFRRWYTSRLGLPWISSDAAIACLEQQRRYYALLFSHEFAIAFWKPGEEITFQVAAQTFQRRMPDGSIRTVTRKPFTRRSARRDAWRYHLREMALAEEPLRYIRRYLHVEDELVEDPPAPESSPHRTHDAQPDTLHHAQPDTLHDAQPESSSPATSPAAHQPGSPASVGGAPGSPARKRSGKPLRPLPDELPAFLRRPYP